MVPGQWVTITLIGSEGNFITQAISNYLTKKFEEQYQEQLSSQDTSKIATFRDFKTVVGTIRRYIPL